MKKITNGVALNTIVTRPRSRGEVKLNSSDPSKKPLIEYDPNEFFHFKGGDFKSWNIKITIFIIIV